MPMSAAPRLSFPPSSLAGNDPRGAIDAVRAARDALPLSTRAALATMLARHRVLVVPGWNNSGPDHWQSRWQQEFPAIERVGQANWATPDPDDWVRNLDGAVHASKRPVVLVAHSLGCVTVARWAAQAENTWPVVGALLVAPADVERAEANVALQPFAPVARRRLPFTARVVGSSNDPCCSEQRAREFADAWGAGFNCVYGGGHINVASGHGHWPQGLALLAWLL